LEEEVKLHLISFLYERRNTNKNTKEQQAIDISLLKLLIELDDQIEIKEFLLNKNNIDTKIGQELLMGKQLYFFYSHFKRGEGFLDQSLEILKKYKHKTHKIALETKSMLRKFKEIMNQKWLKFYKKQKTFI
jgi:hypothetical protein